MNCRLPIAECGLAALVALLLVSVPHAAGAQEPLRDSLQARVTERFLFNYRNAARLTDDQFLKLQDALRRSTQERAELQRRERDVWMALEGQMRPGVAADADSVRRLLDALVALQAERAEQLRREQAAMGGFLTPVQRALFAIEFRRLQARVEDIRRQRRMPLMRMP